MINNKKAFTIVELLAVLFAVIILAGAAVNIYTVGLGIWNNGSGRSSVRNELSQSLEIMTRNLRKATSIDALSNSSITFTADLGSGSDSYRYYLYNSADAEPNPPYSEDFYELRWAESTVTYGSGNVLSESIPQPTTAVFSQSGNVITLDLKAQSKDEIVRMRTNVRPRNL